MRYALIQDGTVVNVIETEEDFANTLDGFDAVIASDEAGIGWTWDGDELSPPPQPPAPPAPAPDPDAALKDAAGEFLLGLAETIK